MADRLRQRDVLEPGMRGSTTRSQTSGGRTTGGLLPRLRTAPPTAPGTPPALSHYADLTISRRFNRSGKAALDIEQVRAEVEAQERAEAEFWGYGRKVRPGSRMGLDNRKMPAMPPWTISPEVAAALTDLEHSIAPLDRIKSGMLNKMGKSGPDPTYIQTNNFGRVVPYQLIRNAPMLAGFTSEDMPVPRGKSEKGCITVCEFAQGEGPLFEILHTRQCDVLLGNQIPVFPDTLAHILPSLRLCLLSGNSIGNRTRAVAEALHEATKLTHLTLGENRIGDKGIALLTQAMSNTTLISLDLHRNIIDNDGAAAIGAKLQRCSCYELMEKAIEEGQAGVVEAVLVHGHPVNPIYPDEEPLLLRAARAGSAPVCECLLDRGADMKVRDSEGCTAAMQAAKHGHKSVLTLLLDRGAEMDAKDCLGQSALILAARYGHVGCLRVLIGMARILPQRVNVRVAGIRDLQVNAQDEFDRLSSNASRASKGSKSAWGKVRGVAHIVGMFSRSSSRSQEESNKGQDDSGHRHENAGSTTDGADAGASGNARTTKAKAPGLLTRVSSFTRSLSFASTTKDTDDKPVQEDKFVRTSSVESTFGRLPSTDSAVSGTHFGGGHAVRTMLIAGDKFGHPGPSSEGFQRLPSVSEDQPELLDANLAPQFDPHTRNPEASAATGLGSRSSTGQHSNVTAIAMARAPKLSKRPSQKIWGAGNTDLKQLLTQKKEMDSNTLPTLTEGGESGSLESQPSSRPRTTQESTLGQLLRRTSSKGVGGQPGSLAKVGSFLRSGSFKRSLSSNSNTKSIEADTNDLVHVRISIGKHAQRQEFTTPQKEVSRKSGSIELVEAHQFRNISSAGGINTRLKLELLYKDPQNPSEDPRVIALCVEDIDDVLLGKKESLDGWFSVKDFQTRRRVANIKCVLRSMPEQFYDTCFFGDNVLIHAARSGKADCVRILLDSGLSPSLANREGNTPLIVAAQNGHRSTVELLLRHGADISAKNQKGLTAMDMASKFEQMAIFRVLQGVQYQQSHASFQLARWPLDDNGDDSDPISFLKDCYRGAYMDSSLVIEVVGAKHLPAADLSGKSDPYVTLDLNGMKYSTNVVRSSLQPTWNETFSFQDQSLGVWEEQHLRVEVYDWDVFGEADLLGYCNVDVSAMAKLQPPKMTAGEAEMGEAWFALRNEGRVVMGQHDDILRADGRFEESEVCLRFRYTPAIGRYVQVGIMEARNLPPKLTGKNKRDHLPSAFATIAMGNTSYRTEPVKKNANPVWHREYRFSAKNMAACLQFEVHELQLAKQKIAGTTLSSGKTILEPGTYSLMGQVAAPLEKLLSLANANLKDLWVELTDNDGVQLKDENGITSAIRIVFNFVVLGENSQSWETMDEDMLYSERKTKLNSKVSSAVSSLIQTPDEHELAVSEFQRLQETFENQIPLEGMTQAAKVMSVTMSVEVLMLRMLINTASGEHVSEFDEFCKVLKILPKDYPSEEYQEEGISEGENLTENLTILENEAAREKIVKMDLDPVVGLRVVFTRDALNRFPELMHDSGWSLKDGPGVGTILWVNPYDLDGDGMVGDICQVLWQKTGKKGHYKTGYHGEYHLAAFEPPKPRLDEKQLSRLKDEFVVQKDLPASIGMRVVARKLSLALFPELEEQSRGQVGTIVWIQPAFVKGDVLIEQGATVEVVWGPSKKRCVVQTGLNNNYQLALHEEKSAITLDEISRLEGKHAFSFLQTLILDDNHIGDRGASSLGESLKGNWMLKTLSLKRNRIAREGGNQLGLGLQHKNVLRELNLSQNTLRDDGILELCHALLLKTCPLQKLDLESNQISYAGCRMLAKALMGTNNMSHLILKNNLVGSDGAGLLEQGIRRSASLQCLDISGNVLGNFGFRALMRSLRRIPPGRGKKAQPGNRSLVSIDVSNNNLNDDCINELEETLLKNRTLLYLTTDNNVFSEEGLYKIGRILASNKRHAQLEKAVVLLQCLFRGRKERLARANARGQQLELRESKAPEVGDRVNVDNLQGNLKRYNGKFGMIESLEFDIDHRQWVNVKLEDNIRALPIRCLRRCVTVVKTPDATNVESSKQQKDKKRDALPATVKIENALGNLDSVSEVDHHKESEGTDENRVKQNAESMEKEFLIGSAGFETKSGPELRDQKGAGESDVTTPQDKAGVPAISASATKLSETPRSGSSGVSSMSGISDLARESLDLLNKLPGSDSEGLVNSILQFESPLAGALLRKIARKEWPASAGVRPTTQHQVNENEWLESVSQSDRPRTYGGKSIKEQDLMLAAARLTLVNMGDALMQQQKAAEEIAMEASRRCMEAAEHYASLEVHLKAVIVSEDTSEEDVKIALQALADAEEAAIRTIEQAEEADEAARRALHATKKFQQFESEEEELEKAISGLNRHEDDDDDADLPTDRRPMSGISEVSKYDSPSARARSVASSKSPRKVTERSSHSSGDGSHMGSIQDDATSQILSNTRSTGMDVAACFKRLKCVLEDSEEDGESVEAAVAEFNRAQDEAMLAFDLAIKSVEEETSTIRVYQEDSRTFVETVRQEMSEAYERLQTAQDANGDEAEFVDALTEFFERSAHISQLVIRAEIFRLGSSLSRSSSGGGSVTSSVTREVAVREEADMRLRFMLNEAMCKPWRCVNKAAITPIGDDFYTSREEAAAILIQSLLRGARTRWKNRITHTKPERQIHSQMVSIHDKQYSEEEVNAAIKIQGLSRGSRDRSRVHTMKRLGRTPVGKQYLEFIDSQPDEVVERMHQIATKVQSIHRGSMTRKRMTSGSVMEDVLGLDMLSKSESARQARRHLAERLACGHGADADDLNRDEERLRNDLASEMMTRHSQPDGGRKNPPAGSPGHHASHRREIEHVFGLHHEENVEDNPNIRDDSHDGPDQPYNAGKKRGSVDKGAVMGFLQGIGECLMSFNESPEKKESEYIDALKAEKYQNHLRQDDDVSRHRAEIDELLHSDHKLTKHEQEIIDADREAGKMMSKIRLQALHELEDALGEGLLDNLEYDNPDENDDETDSPTEHQGKSIVSFPTLREFKIMQARSNLPVKEEVLVLKVAAKGLANLDGLLGKSDPYLKFLRKEPDGSHTNVGQTTIIQNDLNPIWPVVELKMDSLCFNDREHEFRIECWDSDASAFNPLDLNKDDLIGWLDTSVVQLLRMQPLCLKHPTSEHAYGEGASKDVHVANSPPRASALASRALDKISQQFSGQASENAGMLTIESIEVRRIDAAPKNRDDEPGALQDAERQRAREQEVEAEEQQKLVHEENEAEAQQDRGASRLQGIFTVAHVNKDHLKEFYSKHSADSVSGPGSPIERAGNSLMAKREKAKQVSPLHK